MQRRVGPVLNRERTDAKKWKLKIKTYPWCFAEESSRSERFNIWNTSMNCAAQLCRRLAHVATHRSVFLILHPHWLTKTSLSNVADDRKEHERQWTYNVTLRRAYAIIDAVEKSNKYYLFWVCICSLKYPAWDAHAPYYIVICGLTRSAIFFHIIS